MAAGRWPPKRLLVPVIELQIPDDTREANWSAAFADLLSGQVEASIEGGRADVLTAHYAIEVDRLDKWHEAIGQALHYGLVTKKIPVVALIISPDAWPLSQEIQGKLLLIDAVCASKGIRLVLLRQSGD